MNRLLPAEDVQVGDARTKRGEEIVPKLRIRFAFTRAWCFLFTGEPEPFTLTAVARRCAEVGAW